MTFLCYNYYYYQKQFVYVIIYVILLSWIQQQQQQQHAQQPRQWIPSFLWRFRTLFHSSYPYPSQQCSNSHYNNSNSILFVYGYDYYSYPYIYPTEDEPANSSYPVQDYIQKNTNYRLVKMDRPSFLYNPTPDVYRIVEYYVHWCGRCRAFKSHYIAISRRIVSLASKHNKTIEIHAMSCTPNKPLCMLQGIKGYPKIMIYQPGETIGYEVPFQSFSPYTILARFHIDVDEKDMEEWDIDGAILDAEQDVKLIPYTTHAHLENTHSILSTLFGQEYLNDPELDPNGPIQKQIMTVRHHRRTRTELKNDIHLSLDFILRNGIYMDDNPLISDRRGTFHSFLHLCDLVFPSTWTHTRKLLSELITDFNFAARTELYLLGILDDHRLPDNITEWSLSCNRGDPSLGFTCGVWELLHVITVTTVQYNVIAEKPLGTEMVARTIKEFIELFFPCDYCRDNFVRMFNDCEYHRCTRLDVWTYDAQHGHHHTNEQANQDPNELQNVYNVSHGMELALWLFEVHNGVNLRLLREKYENHNEHIRNPRQRRNVTITEYMNALYPSRKECYKCWKHHYDTDNQAMIYHNDATSFPLLENDLVTNYHRDEVIKFLLLEYGGERTDELNAFQTDLNEQYKIISHEEDEAYIRELNIQHTQMYQRMVLQLLQIIVGCIVGSVTVIYAMRAFVLFSRKYRPKKNISYHRKKI